MDSKTTVKPKRHKKRKSRTEVSSDSDSEPEKAAKAVKSKKSRSKHDIVSVPGPSLPENTTPTKASTASKSASKDSSTAPLKPSAKPPSDPIADIDAKFRAYYMQRVATEFAEDLDATRGADDFREEAMGILVHALQQGSEMFGLEEKRRIVGGVVKKS